MQLVIGYNLAQPALSGLVSAGSSNGAEFGRSPDLCGLSLSPLYFSVFGAMASIGHTLLLFFEPTSTTARAPHQRSIHLKSSMMSSINNDDKASIKHLCTVSLRACQLLTPLIKAIYDNLNENIVKNKPDDSAFTIADGLVQRLLRVLFASFSFRDVIGEEDAMHEKDGWDEMDGLLIPNRILPVVHSTRLDAEQLASTAGGGNY